MLHAKSWVSYNSKYGHYKKVKIFWLCANSFACFWGFVFGGWKGAAASFNVPYGIDVSAAGDVLYVADLFSNRLRRVDTATGDVTTLPTAFTLNWPHDAVIDVAASTVSTIVLLVPDLHNNRIVRQPVAAPQAAS